MNPQYQDWYLGRMEVFSDISEYAIWEERFAFDGSDDDKRVAWMAFRDYYDFAEVGTEDLRHILRTIKEQFHEEVK